MSVSAEPADSARAALLRALGLVLLALVPSLGTLDAPWIAEDAGILAQVREDGPWADWTRSQYDLRNVRFWRPVVSTSWALQEAWTGIAPGALRSLNLALHALAAVLAAGIARRLGLAPAAAWFAGAWAATFPEQGGTCTWLAGRTDLLCAVFLLASVRVALGRRPLLAAPLAFLACASKEFGFLAPLWAGAAALARGERAPAALARAAPAAMAAGVALVWRTLALGGLGGYPPVERGLVEGLAGAVRALGAAGAPTLGALALLAVAGLAQRRSAGRVALAGLLLAASAVVLLHPLLADGQLEPENRRLLYVPECALALCAAASLARPGRTRAGRLLAHALVALVLGGRGVLAWRDTHDWARSARRGEAEVARARAAVAGAQPSTAPVLFTGFPLSVHGAYCLGFGLAARFRAPFPPAPRPVWPWRLLFVPEPARERPACVAPRGDGSLWPLDDPPLAPLLAVRGAGGEALAQLALDERAFLAAEDRSPELVLEGGPPGAVLEVLVVTEHGYEPLALGTLDGAGRARATLMQLLVRGNGVVVGAEVLLQAADLGSTRAYLELRALGAAGEVLAASRWIELTWAADLRERAPRG